ncbi:hypothetical protein [Cutibacterium avidum]|uniref:hypothetical protein n=1 Tax=Cutibacterium avidum TaxID=33010 RepID=UPI00336BAF32
MFLALREIRHQRGRFALIVAVIALIAYLAFFLASLATGSPTPTAQPSTTGTPRRWLSRTIPMSR